MNKKQKVLVLLSGGIDSSACINYYKEAGFEVKGLYVEFGQSATKKELIAVRKVSKFYKIQSSIIRGEGYPKFKHGEIQGRNFFLVASAFLYSKSSFGIIALGIHSGTAYIDCSELFVKRVNDFFDFYTGGNTILGTPFLKFTKPEIFEYCKIKGMPIELTYSCELGLNQPCNKCSSCKDLRTLYASQNHHLKTSKRN